MLPKYSKKLNPSLEDADIMPGLCAKELLNELLREKLGFNGLIISDSTVMAGLATVLPRERAVLAVIAAGCDMFLFTKNTDEDFAFMKKGVEDGVITVERLDEAVTRILALKASLSLHMKNNLPDVNSVDLIGCENHLAVSKEIADKSITLVKDEAGVLPISAERYPRVLLYGIEGAESSICNGVVAGAVDRFADKLRNKGFAVTKFEPGGGWEGLSSPTSEITNGYDLIIYVANLATKSNQTVVRIEWAEPMGANVPTYINSVPTIFISLENPYHLIDVPRVKTYINTYGSTDIILDELIKKLLSKSSFIGRSPVDVFCGKWDTRL